MHRIQVAKARERRRKRLYVATSHCRLRCAMGRHCHLVFLFCTIHLYDHTFIHTTPKSRRENWDGGRRAEPKEMACGGFISLGVYMTVAALIGIVLFIGVILARKEVHDFVNLVTMVQWLVYLGIAFVVFTSLLLIGAYRLD